MVRIALKLLCGVLTLAPVEASKATVDVRTGIDVEGLVSSARSQWLAGEYAKSYETARDALAEDARAVDALYLASRFLVFEMLGPEDRGETLRKVDDVAAYVRQCEQEAIGHLVKALGTTPGHRGSRLLLGLVYYEGQKFMRMVGLFEDLRRRQPDDPEAYLMLSLALAATGNDAHARGAFGLALSRLPGSRSYLDAGFSLRGQPGGGVEDLVRSWAPDDPYAMTPTNERLMEHYHRVAYANLRFGEPLRQEDGWQTDRGTVYVLYGAPSERVLIDNDVVPRQEWDYGQVRVSFSSRARNPWVFRSARCDDGQFRHIRDLAARHAAVSRAGRRWPVYDASARFVQFRDDDGLTRVDVMFALPEENVHTSEAGPGARHVQVKRGLTVFSPDWRRLDAEIADLTTMPTVTGPSGPSLVWSDTLKLAPGRYQVALEALDTVDGRLGQTRADLSVRSFDTGEIALSDILVGRRFKQRGEKRRDGFVVLPTVDYTVPKGKRLEIYLEAYNLERDAMGRSDCTVSYEVRPYGKGAWRAVSSKRLSGTSDWEPMQLSLELGEAAPGRKEVRVTVRDEVGQQSARMQTDFTVLW